MEFQKRPLGGMETLGQRLRQLRTEAGLTLEAVSQQTQVAPKYLEAIEEGRYQALPGPVYARNFVRVYIQRMGLNESSAMERFDEEYKVTAAVRPSTRPLMAQRAKVDAAWWQRYRRVLLASLAVLALLSYFVWQAIRLYTPPTLTVVQPVGNLTTRSRSITVSGQTEPGAKVAINHQEIETSANGQFSEKVDVNPGLNTLEISAKKPRSGERVVVRQVLVEQ